MYLNDVIEPGEYTETRASVVPPSRHFDYPMFWVGLSHGTDSVNLGTRDPESLSAWLREMADKLDAKVEEYTASTASEAAA